MDIDKSEYQTAGWMLYSHVESCLECALESEDDQQRPLSGIAKDLTIHPRKESSLCRTLSQEEGGRGNWKSRPLETHTREGEARAAETNLCRQDAERNRPTQHGGTKHCDE